MGRKEQAATQQQQGVQNQVNATNNANAQKGFNFAMPAYQDLYKHAGYDPATKNLITQATEGGIDAVYGAAAEGATNEVAHTRNDAGEASQQDDLARSRMKAVADTTQGNELGFANKVKQDQQTALSGISGLYGTTQGAATGGGNTSANLQSSYNQAAGTPWWQTLLQAGGQVGAAYAGRHS